MLSALAGGLTAAGLAGPLSGGALGAEAAAGSPTADGSPSPTSAEGSPTSPTAPTAPDPGAGAQETGAGKPSTGTSTSSSSTSSSRTSTAPPASTPAASGASGVPANSEIPTIVSQRRQKTTAGGNAAHRTHGGVHRKLSAAHAQPKHAKRGTKHAKRDTKHAKRIAGGAEARKGAAATGAGKLALPPWLIAGQAGAPATLMGLGGVAASAQALAFYRIPPFLLPIYRAAAIQYGVRWQILAAINEIETDYGSDLSVSTAGAVGWMQFMPATWMQYGVDALDAGYADPYNPVDAIFAAARYLRAAGAPTDLRAAILAYNHSDEYVNSVLLRAELISAYPEPVIATLTCLTDGRLPLTGRVAWGSLASAASSSRSSATANATAVAPAAAAAAGVGTQVRRFVDLRSAPNASVVAVQSGRIVGLGDSRRLGSYVILRDVHGDVFTYAGLGSIARSYTLPRSSRTAGKSVNAPAGAAAITRDPAPSGPASAAQASVLTRSAEPARAGTGKARLFADPRNPDALAAASSAASRSSSAGLRSIGADRSLRLRRGSFVAKGTVLGKVRVPLGAKDGHLRFAIRPAGDPSTIDPRPILANWVQLSAALHLRGAHREADLLEAAISDVFVLSKSQLERDLNRILTGPHPTAGLYPTGAAVPLTATHATGAAHAARAAHSASSGRTGPSPLVASGHLSTAQWNRLIGQIGALRAPVVAVKPSSSAISDAGQQKDER